MHARIDQLLSLRDGEPVDADVKSHLPQCAQCAAELKRLMQVQMRLQALPLVEPPPELWDGVRALLDAPKKQRGPMRIAVAVVVAVGIVTTFVARQMSAPSQPAQTLSPSSESQSQQLDAELARLIAQSRELDALLDRLPERPQTQRLPLALAIDSIEQRIQLLDLQLAAMPTDASGERQTERLWHERVGLMDSLVKVRYAEAAPLMF